ncbi:hypothetical protein ACIQ6Y_07545 [Streptomyces sp. NPDC096205]|uniref:hypothetical protein n=1 Tax=Streptomyces sp. NPDC096205 TaxID=3366081 RepID=UPI00380B83DD
MSWPIWSCCGGIWGSAGGWCGARPGGRCNLLGIVWRLHHAWPGSELFVVDEAGHNPGAPGVADLLVAATDKYGRR